MNQLHICRLLGIISLLIGASMVLSLPWAFPLFGQTKTVEWRSILALLGTMVICGLVGAGLMHVGRGTRGLRLYRKEAIAVVGLSWLLATVLGAVPFWLSGTRTASYEEEGDVRTVRMGLFDGIFESASGFSGTGATVLTDLEVSRDPGKPTLVPRAILFWRSETHFLGGLGIMVLFVAVLGMGSAGKALMVSEMPGPSQESAHARTQHAARVFASIFIGLNALLAVLLVLQGVSWFDALCHAFGTIATGGFSTYNKSIEYFSTVPGYNAVAIEMTITLFMFLGCTNFTLLYFLVLLKPGKLLADVEFRTYVVILLCATVLVVGFGLFYGDFSGPGSAVRYGLFQVTSILTNTGFGTHNFDRWNDFSRLLLLVLMYVGGCAGSTSCSIKVVRHILFFKILWLELEQVFRPSVVRPLRLGGRPVEDPDLRHDVLVYFGVILLISIIACLLLVAFEPASTWTDAGRTVREKILDCASAVAATINGVGPGLGIVGESENYAHFHFVSKFVLTWLMLLGRLEVFVLLVLFVPRFWRSQ